MPVTVRCQCGARFQLPETGDSVRCPKCGQMKRIPARFSSASKKPERQSGISTGALIGAVTGGVVVVTVVVLIAVNAGGDSEPSARDVAENRDNANKETPPPRKTADGAKPKGGRDSSPRRDNRRPPRGTSSGRKLALLIGVNKYDPKQLDNLRFPENDVTRLAEVLVKNAGFLQDNVRLLTEKRAFDERDRKWLPTSDSIRRELKLLAQRAEKNDTVLIAFSGHGVQFTSAKENYFCPANADLDNKRTLIGLKSEVYALLDGTCAARVKLLLVDACRNEPRSKINRSRREINLRKINNPQELELPKGIAAFFSCKANQESFEDPDLKHGVFLHFVIEGLKGKAANEGTVTLSGLKEYVRRRVIDYVDKKLNGIQTPDLRENSTDVITLVEASERVLVKEITNSIGMKLRLIPAGTFMMGSPEGEGSSDEQPQHEVEITKPFYMGVYEVTQAEYEKVMGKNPSFFKKEQVGKDTGSFPVERVSWYDAVEFCKKLSELASEKRAGRVYRLPTEAEWEYACRGGAKKYQVFAFGNSLSSKQANFNGNYPYGGAEKGKYLERTCKVGSYQENGFGLYDMHGNVCEWCSDFYSDKTYTKGKRTDPTGPTTGDVRSVRGGSRGLSGYTCRSAYRCENAPDYRNLGFGFRIVLSSKK